jgi:hypothetical protein
VYHGYTLTSKIPFQDVISVVKFYIESNPAGLPIILSLENHCSPLYQRTMAVILTNTLKDMLYVPDECHALPSPNELIGRVIIKGKRPPEKEDIEAMAMAPELFGQGRIVIDKFSVQPITITVEALAKLTLLSGVSFKDFVCSMKLPCTDMHSFSETKIAKVVKCPENVALWREYNR